MSDCGCHGSDHNHNSSNSGFIFGLICGAVIGAVIAIIIYKNNKSEVFTRLEQKIRSFFEDIIPKSQNSETQKSSPKKTIAKSISPKISTQPESREIKPIFVKAKKTPPKMFVKPKK